MTMKMTMTEDMLETALSSFTLEQNETKCGGKTEPNFGGTGSDVY